MMFSSMTPSLFLTLTHMSTQLHHPSLDCAQASLLRKDSKCFFFLLSHGGHLSPFLSPLSLNFLHFFQKNLACFIQSLFKFPLPLSSRVSSLYNPSSLSVTSFHFYVSRTLRSRQPHSLTNKNARHIPRDTHTCSHAHTPVSGAFFFLLLLPSLHILFISA